MFSGFTSVEYYRNMGKSPAMTNIHTGALKINRPVWDKLKKAHKEFVALHELGHYKLNTFDEFAADEFAIKEFFKKGKSLDQAIYAMTGSLDESIPEHKQRANRAYRLALRLKDGKKNKDTKRETMYEHNSGAYETNFWGKKGKARRVDRRSRKADKKATKQEEKLERIRARGASRAGVAAAGGNAWANRAQDLLGGLFGGGGTQAPIDPGAGGNGDDPTPIPPVKEGMDPMIIGIIVVVVVVIGYFYMKNRNKV